MTLIFLTGYLCICFGRVNGDEFPSDHVAVDIMRVPRRFCRLNQRWRIQFKYKVVLVNVFCYLWFRLFHYQKPNTQLKTLLNWSLRQTVFRASQCHNTKLWRAETGCSLVSTEYAHGKVGLSGADLLVVLPMTNVRISFWPEGGSTFHRLMSRYHRKGANLEIIAIIPLIWVWTWYWYCNGSNSTPALMYGENLQAASAITERRTSSRMVDSSGLSRWYMGSLL